MMVLSALLLAASAALAAPDPMLRQLDPLQGPLRCSGTAYANPMSPQHATSGEVTTKWEMDGYWLAFTYAEKKTTNNPMPFRVSGFFGYDPEIKKLVMGGVDSTGGYSTEQSDGWNGDTIVFTGPWHMSGQTMNSRDTFTKKGSKELMHTGEVEQNGQWVKAVEETCVRK